MLPDLERLIALQKLDTTADAARRTLADEPEGPSRRKPERPPRD